MITYIYTLSDPETGNIRYVGKTNNIKERFRKHLEYKNNNKRKTYLYSWMKSIKNDPIIEVIDEVSNDNWQFWERYWISQFITWGFNLTNLTDGGDGLTSFSPEVIEKLKSINSGENNPMWGKKHSKETIDKIQSSRSWYKGPSEETKRKISKSKMGHEVSEETREKLRIYNLKNNHRRGKKNSDYQKQATSEKVSKPIICVETGQKFKSSKEACDILNMTPMQIIYLLKKRNKKPSPINFEYL